MYSSIDSARSFVSRLVTSQLVAMPSDDDFDNLTAVSLLDVQYGRTPSGTQAKRVPGPIPEVLPIPVAGYPLL